MVLRGCGHASCESCLRRWLTEQLRQGRACTCLMPGCASPLSPAERRALLPAAELALYERLQLTAAAAAAGSGLYPCPAARCSNIVHWEPRAPPPPCAEGAGPQSAQSVVWREPDWPCLRCPPPCGVGSCTLQPRCNHAATKLQPRVLRLQPCASDQPAGASRVPSQLRARAPQVESCLLCGASPYHRGTSCVEHRAAVAAAAGVAAEQERVVVSSSGVAVSES